MCLLNNACARSMALPQVKLVVYLTIRVVVFDEQLRLFKIGKRFEREEAGLRIGVEREQVLWVSGATSRDGHKLPCWYHLGRTFGMGVVKDKCLPELERPICRIQPHSTAPGRNAQFVWLHAPGTDTNQMKVSECMCINLLQHY